MVHTLQRDAELWKLLHPRKDEELARIRQPALVVHHGRDEDKLHSTAASEAAARRALTCMTLYRPRCTPRRAAFSAVPGIASLFAV